MQMVSSGQADNASIHANRKPDENACKDPSNKLEKEYVGNPAAEILHQGYRREAIAQHLNARHSYTGGSKAWNSAPYPYANFPRSSLQVIYLASSHVRDCCAL
jgi:ferredoxin-NADP reductase